MISMEKVFFYQSPIGVLLIKTDDFYLKLIKFVDNRVDLNAKIEINQILAVTIKWLDKYFSHAEINFTPLIDFTSMTPFQKEILQLIMSVNYGQTSYYFEIAEKYALRHNLKKMSSQAIGNALNKNPFAIIVPCHRIISKSGDKYLYAWGKEKKKMLLDFEKSQTF